MKKYIVNNKDNNEIGTKVKNSPNKSELYNRNVDRSTKKVKKTMLPPKPLDLDTVLVNELGQFGRFQLYNLLLVSVPVLVSAFFGDFIFSAATIPHRCQVPECGETTKDHTYEPAWLPGAIPLSGAEYSSCERFVPVGNASGTLDICPATYFTEGTEPCEGFVYANTNSVVYDFDLGCQEWLRAFAGTLANFGSLLVLPITGYISDNYGRKVALIFNILNFSIFGLIRAFSVNYTMYLVLQLVQSTLGGAIYPSAYIFATELVGPKYRVWMSVIISSIFSVGLVIVGGAAWLIQPWRYYLIALHVPGLLILLYFWLLSESVRWLLSKKKFDEARVILEKVAKVNGTQISEKSMEALMNSTDPVFNDRLEDKNSPSLIKSVFKSRVLLQRVCTTPIWWITTTFVYYGLSINATSLSDTMYLNYILVCAIEIPGSFLAIFMLDSIGRKTTLSIGFFFTAICNIAFAFMPYGMTILRLLLFLSGKFSISMVFTALYLYTSELYPTEYRHTLLAFSSMIGRLGSITAPLTPVLMIYWEGIPSVLFGSMALLSGVLVLTQPETLGTKMPDTLAEAEALGRPESKVDSNAV